MLMTAPNTRLRAVRLSLRMSRSELARAVRAAGERAGEPNNCSEKAVQRWESGVEPRGAYLRALEMATGQPAEQLGFKADERYGLDKNALGMRGETWLPEPGERTAAAPLNGIWRSRYEYPSSGRGAWFHNAHYVLLIQQGDRLQVRSLPGTSAGRLLMDLTVNGQIVTGTWTEETSPAGYYRGAVYHGAVQMFLDPTGRRMSGKWVGFGRDFDMNDGPWALELVTSDTSPESQEAYNRPAQAEPEGMGPPGQIEPPESQP